jgi:hypothetical protein
MKGKPVLPSLSMRIADVMTVVFSNFVSKGDVRYSGKLKVAFCVSHGISNNFALC